MKKRFMLPFMVLVLSLVMVLPIAAPVMAAGSIDVDISVSPTEVSSGETVTVQVTVTNNGSYNLENVYVNLGAPLNTAYGPEYLTVGASKTWTLTYTVYQSTIFSADATGAIVGCGSIVCDSATASVTVVPCEEGDEGLTPGYWKNHLGDWPPTGYSPDDSFKAVFSVGPDVTLLQALNTGGGGEAALGRHAVAALLNAAHPNINYEYSVGEVIAMVQDAYATGDYEGTKDILEDYNELEGDINS